jgi:hypothetical protein
MIADLLVLAPELPEAQLLVEVEVGEFDKAKVEEQLALNMAAWNCPIALLVTPVTTWLIRDAYEENAEPAIRATGEYPTADLLDLDSVPKTEHELLAVVHRWLENLAMSGMATSSRANARLDVTRYVLPAIVEGRVVQESRQ